MNPRVEKPSWAMVSAGRRRREVGEAVRQAAPVVTGDTLRLAVGVGRCCRVDCVREVHVEFCESDDFGGSGGGGWLGLRAPTHPRQREEWSAGHGDGHVVQVKAGQVGRSLIWQKSRSGRKRVPGLVCRCCEPRQLRQKGR